MLVLKSDGTLGRVSKINGRIQNAGDIYDLYATYVTGVGGAIADAAATEGLIEDLVEAGVYAATAIAINGGGGAKNLSGVATKLYSVAPGFMANDYNQGSNVINRDTTSFAWDAYHLVDGGSAFGWNTFVPKKANATTILMRQSLPTPQNGQGQGIEVYFDGVARWSMTTGQNTVSVNSTPNFPFGGQGRTGPEYAPTPPFHAVWHWDWDADQLWMSENGIDDTTRARVFSNLPDLALNLAVPLKVSMSSVTNARLDELIVINGPHSLAQAQALAALRDARYP